MDSCVVSLWIGRVVPEVVGPWVPSNVCFARSHTKKITKFEGINSYVVKQTAFVFSSGPLSRHAAQGEVVYFDAPPDASKKKVCEWSTRSLEVTKMGFKERKV